jgi:hypothetical protein
LPYSAGQAWFTTFYDDEARPARSGTRCDHADPRILIAAELLRAWHEPPNPDYVEFRCVCPVAGLAGSLCRRRLEGRDNRFCDLEERELTCCPTGDVVTIRCSNQTVVYQIKGYDAPRNAWFAEWPD